ncbi:hypothetical_protein [Leishmania braziliensis MHOM/BR/75/M2904]|uniref:Hypothetical_protein n=1 Tax=Leishmania braziliensis MHOM/BR/75/M2904 TaxID=420245 RepID=A0A3P3ZEX9_LEIBR|nr:hypothetical protein MNV84_06637 [Leishmania braziliensis]SYZ68697.1 hypothetical_protein [Leishmania braziliensis MHOM/BR/75/M2904]
MRGNPYSRGFDPMKSRSERRKEKQAKLAKTKRVIRLKRRLGRIAARKFAGQEDSHMTALMESYILRRKAERAAAKAKEPLQDDPGAPGEAGSSGEDSDVKESEVDDDEDCDSSSLVREADSAFEVNGADDDDDDEGQDDTSTMRRRAVQRKQAGYACGRGDPRRGSVRRREGASLASTKVTAALRDKHGRSGVADRNGQGVCGGHSAHRGGGGHGCNNAQHRENKSSDVRSHGRSRKVLTRSFY